jgi:uncharacterized protein
MTRHEVLVPKAAEAHSKPGEDASPADIWAYSQQLRFARAGGDKWAEIFSLEGVLTYPFAAVGSPRRLEGRAEVERKGVVYDRSAEACPAELHYVIHETSDQEVIVVEATEVADGTGAEAARQNNMLHVLRVRRGEIMLFADYGSSRSVARILSGRLGPPYDEHHIGPGRSRATPIDPGDVVSSWPATRPGPLATAREVWEYGIYLHTSHELIGGYASLYAPDGVIEFPFLPSGYPTPGFPNRIHGRDQIQRRLIPRLLSNHKMIRMLGLRSIIVHDTGDPSLIIVEFEGVYKIMGTGEVYSRPQVQIKRVRNGELVHVKDYFNISLGPAADRSTAAPS